MKQTHGVRGPAAQPHFGVWDERGLRLMRTRAGLWPLPEPCVITWWSVRLSVCGAAFPSVAHRMKRARSEPRACGWWARGGCVGRRGRPVPAKPCRQAPGPRSQAELLPVKVPLNHYYLSGHKMRNLSGNLEQKQCIFLNGRP